MHIASYNLDFEHVWPNFNTSAMIQSQLTHVYMFAEHTQNIGICVLIIRHLIIAALS